MKISEVFGVSSNQVKSYIEREHVDNDFLDALESDKQIVVYGASKQGKTALVSRYLDYEKNVVISLTPKTRVLDIYQSILRQSGIQLKSDSTQGSEMGSSVGVAAKFKAIIPLFGSGEAETTGEINTSSSEEVNYREVPLNLELPQDISEVLRESGKDSTIVILENFHYLDEEKQREFAFDLRNFQELNIKFVILGVWREKNRLIQFNGDLLDRVTEIPVEPWAKPEFEQVAEKGASFLNISFSKEIIDKTTEACFSSIGVFQELLKQICLLADITESQAEHKLLDDLDLLKRACQNKAIDYTARHERALEAVAAGNRSTTAKDGVQPLFLKYYLIKVILSEGYKGLETGMRRSIIQEKIQSIHHRGDDVRASDMSNLLHNIAKTQARKSISPPIIDYDQSKKLLQIVDSTFYFFLKYSDLDRISSELSNPLEN